MILVRHGESEWNVLFSRTRIDPDIPDPPLTPEGRLQATRAAESLLQFGVERLLVSPYARTLETAEIIAGRLGIPIAVEPLVRERAAFSCDVGTPRSRLASRWPRLSFDHIDEIWWPAAESEAELEHRCGRFRQQMLVLADWPRVAVVSHWGFIRGLTGQGLRNGELLRFDPGVVNQSIAAD
jgi:broad specificity phosphatase PhoE